MKPLYDFGNVNCVHEHFFVERKGSYRELTEVILSGASALILGMPRVGKSAFVSDFCTRFRRSHPRYSFGNICFKGTDILFGSDIPVVEQIKRKVDSLALKNRGGKVVLVFDEFNYLISTLLRLDLSGLTDVINFLNELIRKERQIVLVTQASSDVMFGRNPELVDMFPSSEIMQVVSIPLFADSELTEYCSHSVAPAEDYLEIIKAVTQGHAGGVNVLLRALNIKCGVKGKSSFKFERDVLGDDSVQRALRQFSEIIKRTILSSQVETGSLGAEEMAKWGQVLKGQRRLPTGLDLKRFKLKGGSPLDIRERVVVKDATEICNKKFPCLSVDLEKMSVEINGKCKDMSAEPVQFAIMVLSLVRPRDWSPQGYLFKIRAIAESEVCSEEFEWCRQLNNSLKTKNINECLRQLRNKIENDLLGNADILECRVVSRGQDKKNRLPKMRANWSEHIAVRWLYKGVTYNDLLGEILSSDLQELFD